MEGIDSRQYTSKILSCIEHMCRCHEFVRRQPHEAMTTTLKFKIRNVKSIWKFSISLGLTSSMMGERVQIKSERLLLCTIYVHQGPGRKQTHNTTQWTRIFTNCKMELKSTPAKQHRKASVCILQMRKITQPGHWTHLVLCKRALLKTKSYSC